MFVCVGGSACVRACVRMCACVRASMRACVSVGGGCLRAYIRACVAGHSFPSRIGKTELLASHVS